jgi:hypothetical protein
MTSLSESESNALISTLLPVEDEEHRSVAPPSSAFVHLAQASVDIVTSNLMKLGTLSLHDFLSPTYHDPPPPEVNLTLSYVARPAVGPVGEERKLPAHQSTPLFLLHQVCSQTFGSIEPLKYEFIDDPDNEGVSATWA